MHHPPLPSIEPGDVGSSEKYRVKEGSVSNQKKTIRAQSATCPTVRQRNVKSASCTSYAAIRRTQASTHANLALTMPPRMTGVPLKLSCSRETAVNSIALKTLLSAKVGNTSHQSFCGGTLTDADVRQVGLLKYIKEITTHVDNQHLDLSHCSLSGTDFIFLKAVLQAHPNVTAVNMSGAVVTQMAARNLLEAVCTNPQLFSIDFEGATIGEERGEIERQLQINRRRAESRGSKKERKAEERKLRTRDRIATKAVERIHRQLREGRAAIRASEHQNREQCISLFASSAARILRNSARITKKLRYQDSLHQMHQEEAAERITLRNEEEAECRLVAEIQEYAVRRVKQGEVVAEVSVLKRMELISWSVARRGEKHRKQNEHLARECIEDDAISKKFKISDDDYPLVMKQITVLEVQERHAAQERQTERQDREAREAWLKEREAKEAIEREVWTKKQQELEKDIRIAQQEKQREAIVKDEARLRQQYLADQDVYREILIVMQQEDCRVTRAIILLTKLEQGRSQHLDLPPTVEFVFEPCVNKPRTAYIGDCLPIQCVSCPTLEVSLPDDFVTKLDTLDRQIQLALKSLNEAYENANKELAKLRNKNEAILGVLLGRFLAMGAAGSIGSLLAVIPASPRTPFRPHTHFLSFAPPLVAAVTAALIAVCRAYTPVKRKNKLKDTVRQSRLNRGSRSTLNVYPENVTHREVPPELVATEKLVIRGGEMRVSVTGGAVPSELFSCIADWSMQESRQSRRASHQNLLSEDSAIMISDGGMSPFQTPVPSPRNRGMSLSNAGRQRKMSMTAGTARRRSSVRRHSQTKAVATPPPQPAPQQAPIVGNHITVPFPSTSISADTAALNGTCISLSLPPGSDEQQPPPQVLTTEAIGTLITNVRYRFEDREKEKDKSAEDALVIPTQRDLSFCVVLNFSGSELNETLCVTRTAGAAVIIVNPLISLGGEQQIEYTEDTPADACRILNVHLSDPIAPLFTDQGYQITALSFHNYVLRLTFTEGYTLDDVLLYSYAEGLFLKHGERRDLVQACIDNPPTMGGTFREEDCSCDEPLLIWLDDKENDRTVPIGEVIRGGLFAVGRPPYKNVVPTPEIAVRWHSSLATPENLRKVLKRFRFGNFSQDPVPGDRVLQIGMIDINRDECRCEVVITVFAEDDAATMTLQTNRVHYRQITATSHPANYRQYLSVGVVHPFLGIRVEDVDTDRFVGGYLECTLSSSQRGDVLLFSLPTCDSYEDSRKLTAREPQSIHVLKHTRDDSVGMDLMFEGRCVGSIVKGMVLDTSGSREEWEQVTSGMLENGAEELGLGVVFSEKGDASIACCSKIFEAVVWGSAFLRPKDGERTIDICLQPGSSYSLTNPEPFEDLLAKEFDPPLEDKVSVRILNEFFEVSQSSMSYREGSGPVRLAPFELTNDPTIDFTGGYISAKIVKGYIASDILGMRDSAEIKVVLREDSNLGAIEKGGSIMIETDETKEKEKEKEIPKTPDIKSLVKGLKMAQQKESEEKEKEEKEKEPKEPEDDASEAAPTTPSASSIGQSFANALAGASKMSKIRAHLKPQPAKKGLGNIKDMISATQRQRTVEERLQQGHSVTLDVISGAHHLGVLKIFNGGLTFHFMGKAVKRRDVIAVMRSITYSNISSAIDADALVKYIRISACDAQHAVTESIIHVEIQEVDDVTDIVLTKPRRTYRLGSPEIERFGGLFPLVHLGTGWLADPDTLWFTGGSLTVELVAGHSKSDTLRFMSVDEQRSIRETAVPEANCPLKSFEDLPYLEVQGEELVDVDTGVVVANVYFPKVASWSPSNNIRIEFTKVDKVVSIHVAGYCLNCVSYSTQLTEKNVALNSQKMYHFAIDDGVNPETGKAKLKVDIHAPLLFLTNADLKTPCVYFDEVTTVNHVATLCPKTTVNWVGGDKKGANRESILHGHLTVTIHTGKKDGDTIFLKKDYSQAVGKLPANQDRLHLEFSASSKMKTKQIQDLVRNIAIKTTSEGLRVVKIHGTDATSIPTEVFITVYDKGG